ncbi:glycosyltransferase [Hydrogenimonas thermophila]|uniref:Glycosyltransferase involved in cell wall bisynthesis n=1 Tax=Hydrogenimonas thermophila TaxID=223786 RepID=A0A1I5LAA0_9BACT|nr:glycosyltransferase [Hydrogenimonas thermophila]SFO93796.1 Glycosyltransferase involved in cell wall bisynthesis [Hydrogenimonas thermophila]
MTLSLFFTRGVSLEQWLKQGLFEREKLIYEEHLKQGNLDKVYWFTYGSEDRKLANRLKSENRLHKNIEVFEMPKVFNITKIGSYLYSFFLPFIYRKELQKSNILKTNQTDGSWTAVISKKIYGKKLLYRTGYTMSQLENNLKRFNIIIRKCIELVEKFAYNNCDKAIVSSNHNVRYLVNKYSIDTKKIEVIYNFIDRNRFYDFNKQREKKVVFVGRLSEEKNIFNLIEAIHSVDLPLDIYGSGPLKNKLESFIKENNYNVRLLGNISNSLLPEILNKAKYFALVSIHEGMPKSLIEGMACGCICIGTNVSGINEVITEGNGILALSTSSNDIREAFIKALSLTPDEEVKMRLLAKEFIDKNFTLHNVVAKEQDIFKKLCNE